MTTRTNRSEDLSSATPFEVLLPDFENLTLDSMLMDLPSYDQAVPPSTLGQEVADLMEADMLLPGVIIMDEEAFLGVVSRDMFFQRTGKLYGTEIFLVRPILKMLNTLPHKPLVLPETTLISMAAKSALSRERDYIYQPIVIEKSNSSYHLISALMLFMAQSHQLLTLHNQRLHTVDSGQKISQKEAIIRFLKHVGNQKHFQLPMFLKRHSVRCDHCGKLVNYSIVDIVRTFPYINQGVIVEEKMGARTYRMYIRHRCLGELWEIPVHHDNNLEYRSQRPARIVESYV